LKKGKNEKSVLKEEIKVFKTLTRPKKFFKEERRRVYKRNKRKNKGIQKKKNKRI
jgi:hypothetical protein